MGNYLKRVTGLFAIIITLLVSCTKPADSEKKIQQSNFVYEDNVNGRIPPPNNVIESTNFFYNDNGTLNSATVYDDTSATANLLKQINIIYNTNSITVNTYLDTVGNVTYYVGFDSMKRVSTITLPDSSGLYLSYTNNKVSEIKLLPGVNKYGNFVYDANNNLIQYEFLAGSLTFIRSILRYNNEIVPREFDSRFLSKNIKFIYLGGLDLMQKIGLNYGTGSLNKLIERTDSIVTTGALYERYIFDYSNNSNGDIVKRNIKFSTDTLYYQFKY